MTFLPIVARELRVASRRNATYWSRVTTGLLASIFGGYMVLMVNHLGLGKAPGVSSLAMFSFPLMGFSFFAGLGAADSLSSEKREGTLGLLFLTDLKGYDVVLGKLCSSAMFSFYGLLASLPVVSFSFMLGGITAGEFARACLVLLNAMFFSHAAAMLISSYSTQMRTAISVTAASIGGFLLFFPMSKIWLEQNHHPVVARMINFVNPLGAAPYVVNFGFRGNDFWNCLIGSHFLAWIFLAAASRHVAHAWQDRAGTKLLRGREWMRQLTFGWPSLRARLRRRLLAVNPYFWLVSRTCFKPVMIWAFMVVVGVVFLSASIKMHQKDFTYGLFIVVQVAFHFAFKMWIASEAGAMLEEPRHNGGLELLLSATPLEVRDILRGCWLALRRLFLWPLVVVVAGNLVLLIFSLLLRKPGDGAEFSWGIIAETIMLPLDVMALGWVALKLGLSSNKSRKAGGKAITRILILPWAVVAGFSVLVTTFDPHHLSFGGALLLWFILGVGVDVLSTISARNTLLTRFRFLAQQSQHEQFGWFAWIGRTLGEMSAGKR